MPRRKEANQPAKGPSVAQDDRADQPVASDTLAGIDRFRDRIVELRRIRAGDMEPHPPTTADKRQQARQEIITSE